MNESFAAVFKEEAYELLGQLENYLIELEKMPDDESLVRKTFRALHTIKGSGAMCGFDRIAKFTHEVETVFDLVRDRKITLTKPLVQLSLTACDIIRSMLDNSAGGEEPADELRIAEAVESFRTLVPRKDGLEPACVPGSLPSRAQAVSGTGKKAYYRIRFRPGPDILKTGTNPIRLLNEMRELGELVAFAHLETIPNLSFIDPESMYCYWDLVLISDCDINAVRDVFMFVEDDSEIDIGVLNEGSRWGDDQETEKLGQILIRRGDVDPQALDNVLKKRKLIGETLIEAGLVTPAKIASALIEQQCIRDARKERQVVEGTSSVRVAAEKLDLLVNLVGELVIAESMVSRNASISEMEMEEFEHATHHMRRIIDDIQDVSLSLRMLPLSATFRRMIRLVHDISEKQGKEVDLDLIGEDTEVDKTVIELIADPLVHIVRNAVDHGIEMPAERLAAGKPRSGRISIEGKHEGGEVWIIIKDNGRGLSREKILAGGIKRGLVTGNGAGMSDNEVFQLIFEPGLSTADNITDISGRGVGMDVVRKNIDKLKGNVDIRGKLGEGSTIVLRIPLTLAIMQGMLVRVGTARYTVPLLTVRESFQPTKSQITTTMDGQEIVKIRNEIIPVIRLHELFKRPPDILDLDRGILIVVEYNRKCACLFVDDILEQYQTVIKGLPDYIGSMRGVSGCTILGNGEVSLILDVAGIIERAEKKD